MTGAAGGGEEGEDHRAHRAASCLQACGQAHEEAAAQAHDAVTALQERSGLGIRSVDPSHVSRSKASLAW